MRVNYREAQMGFKGHQQINFREKEKQLLDKILGHYDKRIRPAGGNGTGMIYFFYLFQQRRVVNKMKWTNKVNDKDLLLF